MPYITNQKCKCCNDFLTIDCLRYELNMCYRCVSSAHGAYEAAHGNGAYTNYKRKKISKELKDYIVERDKNCLSCGSIDDLAIDHITPLSKGGDNSHDNLQLLCRSCNSKKGSAECDYREYVGLN